MLHSLALRFLKTESAPGILLGLAALLALLVENSPLQPIYDALLTTPVIIQLGQFIINKPLLLWINDGLMTIFFLLVGLELKREIIVGQLADKGRILLPSVAALGGLLTPAIIYTLINWGDTHALRGWAIPAATDIAFAIGVISLLGNRIPKDLKLTLVTIAILDDIAAIVIIATFYTAELAFLPLGVGLIGIFALSILNKNKVAKLSPYLIIGAVIWVCVLQSGVHATLAGIIIAIFIPLQSNDTRPLIRLEHNLQPWVAFGVLPLFAFANSSINLSDISMQHINNPIMLGIAVGLFFGKQIGIMTATLLSIKILGCKLPPNVTWRQYYGMAILAGIGFTMSLFIGTLAFSDVASQQVARLGIILGSLASGIAGYVLLRYSPMPSKNRG